MADPESDLWLGPRALMKEGRSQESGVRSQESGVRSQESGVRSQESGVRRQESGVRRQESEVRSLGVRSQKSVSGDEEFDLASDRFEASTCSAIAFASCNF